MMSPKLQNKRALPCAKCDFGERCQMCTEVRKNVKLEPCPSGLGEGPRRVRSPAG